VLLGTRCGGIKHKSEFYGDPGDWEIDFGACVGFWWTIVISGQPGSNAMQATPFV